ncbi:MAG: sulfatase-like hydrolase/transferase, partial [Planctomycetota bacterium]
DGPDEVHLTDRLASDVNGFIEENRDTPFFVYFSFYSVHTPLQGKPELVEKYRRKAVALPKSDKPRWIQEGKFNTTRQVQDHAVYGAMMETLDGGVGAVLDKLEELGLNDNTIVFFMSDNGGLSTSEGQPTSNLPLRGGKGWHFEGGIREPMLIRWPGVTKPGTTCDVPVVSMDFYPTMLEMAGLPAEPRNHLDGKSMVALLRGGQEPLHDAMFWHYPHYSNQGDHPSGAIRVGDYKLIEYFEDGRTLLFNLAKDIGERNDLATKMPDKVASLKAKLRRWQEDRNVKFPKPNPAGWDPEWKPGNPPRKK